MSPLALLLLAAIIGLIFYQNMSAKAKPKLATTCPQCKSEKIVKVDEELTNLKEKSIQGIVTSAGYTATVKRHYRCQSCGNGWHTSDKEVR